MYAWMAFAYLTMINDATSLTTLLPFTIATIYYFEVRVIVCVGQTWHVGHTVPLIIFPHLQLTSQHRCHRHQNYYRHCFRC